MRPDNAPADFDHALDRAIAGEIVTDAGLDEATTAALRAVAEAAPFADAELVDNARAAFARSAESR